VVSSVFFAVRLRIGVCLFAMAAMPALGAVSALMKPVHLRCDSQEQPLGIDTTQPLLSWQLQDPGFGARQTAYQIQVATRASLLIEDRPDIWDSGRVASDHSVAVAYAGSALVAEKRYYWRVKVWGKDGQQYPASNVSWWETGLLTQKNWTGKWIGYEEAEERGIRESGAVWITNASADMSGATADIKHDFRLKFDVAKPVVRATLYVTGKDTAAAWVNGKQVIEAMPMPAWKQFPWKTYTRKDITTELRTGSNTLAVEVTTYSVDPLAKGASLTPMSASLSGEMADGSVALFKSGTGWKAALNTPGNWQATDYRDAGWEAAVPFASQAGAAGQGGLGNPWPTETVKLLRKSFEVKSAVASARLYITALGAYKAEINGRPVGDQVLSPGWMDFREHVPYQVYDVTGLVKAGANVVGALLAPGWYTTPLAWERQGYNYGNTPPALKAQLRIEHLDGTVQWIDTDASWKADVSPILKAEIYDGETYDARRVQAGWDTASFAATGWKPVEVVEPVEPEIVPQYFPPIRVERVLEAKAVTNPKPGVYIFDFKQNLAGVARLRAQGTAGADVQLRFAEVLNPDGTLYVDNLRTAKATDHFILSGKGVEEYQPAFTYHGFRYVEVTGLAVAPMADAVRAVVFHTDAEFTAHLHTGNAMINQLWENILWGQRSNFVSVPTDCPQRDERLGWAADAQVFWRAASYNMDLAQFSKKYAADLRGTQIATPMYGIYAPGTIIPNPGYGAGWSDAGVIIPWTAWLQSGDTRVIEENWNGMEKYLAAIEADNPDHLWKKNSGIPFGDWLSPEGDTDQVLIATAYWAYDVTLMEQMAHALGKTADEARYAALFAGIKNAFAKEFVHADGFVAGASKMKGMGKAPDPMAGDTQTGYVLALQMHLVPDALRIAAGAKLVEKIKAFNWRLGTGFLGTPYLLSALVDTGHADVAYRLLLNTDYPSWGYLVDHGATTMWERWNGDQMRGDPSMNSYNHYAYGAVADWIYRYSAGVDAVASGAGFHTIYLHPNFDARLGGLKLSYMSPYGEIRSAWTIEGKQVKWTVTIPPNSTGDLPLTEADARSSTLDGKPLDKSVIAKFSRSDANAKVYQLPAGTYNFGLLVH